MSRPVDRKTRAAELRKLGHSYNDIHRQLGVSKSTLSYWFSTDKVSATIKRRLIRRAQQRATKRLRLMALANQQRWQDRYRQYQTRARHEFRSLASTPLFVTGIVIYWGEGDKQHNNSIVRVSNVDHRLLRIFTKFLLHSCRVPREKIHVWLILYPDLNEQATMSYWSRVLKIPRRQFLKPYRSQGKEKRRKAPYGICTVQVYSRELKEKIIEWIQLHSQKLQSAGIV